MDLTVLSNRQREQLHKAIHSYLVKSGFSTSAESFATEAKVPVPALVNGEGAVLSPADPPDLLEKKWIAVIRLQKKINDLETKITQLEATGGGGNYGSNANTQRQYLPVSPEKLALTGHNANINCVRYHPSLLILATASEDASIKFWDAETGQFERTLRSHTLAVQDICFSPAQPPSSTNTKPQPVILASCSADLSVKLWDLSSYSCLKTLTGHDHNVSSISFIPPLGDRLVSVSRDKSIRFWSISTGYCLATLSSAHAEWIKKVAIDPSGKYMLTCSADRTVKLWDVEKIMQHFNSTSNTRFSFNKEEDYEDHGLVLSVMRGHEHVIETVAFSTPEADVLIDKFEASNNSNSDSNSNSSSKSSEKEKGGGMPKYGASGGRDKVIKVWELATGRMVMELVGHDNWVRGVMFHPRNGKILMSCSDDKSVRMWDVSDGGRCVRTMSDAHPHFIACMDYSRNGMDLLATGGVDKVVRVWGVK